MIRWRFWRRKKQVKISADELFRLKRENEEARRGHGNPFGNGADPWTKTIRTNAVTNGSTPIIGNPLTSEEEID
jgi:hypothetical protein